MTQYHDTQYLNLVEDVMNDGFSSGDRTGTGTTKLFGRMMRFDLSDGTIPLLTTKKMHLPAIIHEILWYLSGNGNIQYLLDNGVKIWSSWADENGNLGDLYGVMWRRWPKFEWSNQSNTYVKTYIDQIADVVTRLKTNPTDRRMIVNAWNPALLPDDGKTFSENVANGKQALPPCHFVFQFFTRESTQEERIRWFTFTFGDNDISTRSTEQINSTLDNHNIPKLMLSCMMTQRSVDVPIGLPFNIVQYSILTRMFCEVVDMIPGEFVWSGGDCHIYNNQLDQVKAQLERTPYPSPFFEFRRPITNIDDFKYDDFVVRNYQFHPAIKIPVSV